MKITDAAANQAHNSDETLVTYYQSDYCEDTTCYTTCRASGCKDRADRTDYSIITNLVKRLDREPTPAEILIAYSVFKTGRSHAQLEGTWSGLYGDKWKEVYEEKFNGRKPRLTTEEDFTCCTLDEYVELEDAANRIRFAQAHKTNEEDYWEKLEVLPPFKMGGDCDSAFSWFLMSEFTTGTWTCMYACLSWGGKKYYASKTVDIGDQDTWLNAEVVRELYGI